MNISIMDVGPRDGLQNEKMPLTASIKAQLVDKLAEAGIKRIEAGSFVSPKWVPQMANSDQVMQLIHRHEGVEYSALVPNMRGFELAMAGKVDRISVFTAASEAFCQKNINCTIEESIARFKPVMEAAKISGIPVRGYVSCIAGCPYQGTVHSSEVALVSEKLLEAGCDEISLGDTTGVGTPHQVKSTLREVLKSIPTSRLGVHFHDTYGQALANTYASLELGIGIIDSSVAGLGGCPYAKGASGNLSTEDLVYMLNGLGVKTGIQLDKLIEAGNWICSQLGIVSRSKVAAAKAKMDCSEEKNI